jgi:hypothetical protein
MNNTTTILLERADVDDTIGAIIFIIVVLLWYSSSVVFLLGMKIGSPSESFEDSIGHSKKIFTQSFRDKTYTKSILGNLNKSINIIIKQIKCFFSRRTC